MNQNKITISNNLYLDIKLCLEKNKKCLADISTGMGKTYLSINKLAPLFKKVIFVYPTKKLLEEIEEKYDTNNILKITYASFSNINKLLGMVDDYIQDIDHDNVLFIFDEAHHLGGYKASKNIKILMNKYPKINYLGITATPMRIDGVHIGVDFFEGNVVRYTMDNAFKDNVLKKPLYITAEFDARENIDIIRESYFGDGYLTKEQEKEIDKIIKRINRNRAYYVNFEDMLYRNLPDYDHITGSTYQCYLLFYSNTENMMNNVDNHSSVFKRMFPYKNIRVHIISSRKEAKYNDNIKNLSNDNNTIDLIFSVNTLIEGIHIDHVHGVFMFRRTISDRIYIQMIGRVFSITKDDDYDAIIFDMVENSRINYKSSISVRDYISKKKKYLNENIIDIVKTIDMHESVDDIIRLSQKYKDENIIKIIINAYLRDPSTGTNVWILELKKFNINIATEEDFFEIIREFTNEDIDKLKETYNG